MDIFMEILRSFGSALLRFIANPFYYATIGFIILHYRRQMMLERRLYHTRLHSVTAGTWKMIVWGVAVGIACSFVMAFVGTVLHPSSILLIWIVTITLMLFRIRFICIAYAIGIIGILQSLFAFFPQLGVLGGLSFLYELTLEFHMPSLLVVVAILHFGEALLVRYQAARTASPFFCEGKRGKIVGAYQLRNFWPVPLFLFVPVMGAGGFSLPWFTLFGGEWAAGGWTIIAFPVAIGFSEFTLSRLPQQKARKTSGLLMAYSGILLIVAYGAYVWPLLTIGASLMCIVLHEAIVWVSRWDEAQRSPLFVDNRQGLKILVVLPKSAAFEMGLQSGEIVHKVNGTKVLNKEQLYDAMRINPVFCKLEVINLEGQSKFLQRALFADEHHQLGIVFSPDQDVVYYTTAKEAHLFSYLKLKLGGLLFRNRQSSEKIGL